MTKEIVTFKGFNKDLKCRGFQFAIGETFHHDGKVEACGSGFHACECPFDVFSYYPPAESRYAETISFGITDSEEGGDTKIASSSITIKDELTLPQFIQRGIEWIWSKIDKSLEQHIMCGSWSAATNTGNRSAATNTGDCSAAEVSGSQSVAASLGIEGKARASEGGAIVLCYRDEDGELIHIRASKVGENGIMPNTWYQLDKDGEFVECE
ncbi:hypothetical protein AAA17_003868 [Salmonella enterica subsp. enterica serovar Ohio]|uniref:DUF7666 domain-containing protein n=2 Tax=Salmonella enterica I TaxID=59201 RepID=A0A5W1M1N1_SALET|nr:hypothetical protein [Salmonella enterica]EBS6802532.1 hypothetical protein [Salmonella enterica subsp. enterica serovar Virchow]EDI7174789.1 hypothetical protein [Salmonella enterica subsp. enterica serovar Schwarzengrund]EDW2698402.1 hypothetical protein [Salmonella enterica subsp. enterica serovar Ohio]EDW2748633.1 hypothetical protein [Salmonella enterica subsp. enterica]AYP80807.1 hypothetical protein EAE35_07355 [Salmonella enterica subsp. enterica serovar Mbandaka]